MNSFLVIFTLAWAIIYLMASSEAGPKDWTPGERRVYDQLRQMECGVLSNQIPLQKLRRRITGGRRSSLFSQPWMAFIYIPSNLKMCRCGGTLISERFILTAAHCFKMCPRSSELKVRLGELDLDTSPDCTTYDYQRVCAPPAEELGIESWSIHEEFDPVYPWFDIALLRLNRKVVFKVHIRPICLPLTDELLAFTSVIGNSYMAVGWGRIDSSRFANSTMEVYINTETCTNGLDSSFLCANGDYVDTCVGDSGGPLTWQTFYFGIARTVQFGVVSTGSRNCGAGEKAYYMDVPTYMPWIMDKLSRFPNL
ncbi:serine protease grass-like isoform X2 [Drosophila eugracilis]|uniref:serine protease grass-like isoform X2 n=1 Tax=Drosophila eugracilis TaxID=29029 RepID=UPI0007E77E16|nr:serine protease grass-like isoform X2 [Drosophila eugracilis]